LESGGFDAKDSEGFGVYRFASVLIWTWALLFGKGHNGKDD
jgi:hypothetical protein